MEWNEIKNSTQTKNQKVSRSAYQRLHVEKIEHRKPLAALLSVLFETKRDDVIFLEEVNMDELEEQWGELNLTEDDI